MAWSLRTLAALLFVAVAPLLACKDDAPPPAADVAAAVARAPAAAEAPAEPPDRIPGTDAVEPSSPHVAVAIETANDLFFGRHAAVTARLEGRLREELNPAALRAVVAGVVKAHGEPDRLMDAWASDLREEGRVWPTASVLLRMSKTPVRFRLLLVFNPDDTLRGLWLRPI